MRLDLVLRDGRRLRGIYRTFADAWRLADLVGATVRLPECDQAVSNMPIADIVH